MNFDLILLGVVVVLIFVRLRSLLGTRPDKIQIKLITPKDLEKLSDTELQKLTNFAQKQVQKHENIMNAKLTFVPSDEALSAIPYFNKIDFLARAAKAFEMILTAFAAQDLQTLKTLTTPKLYERFEKIIHERNENNIIAETELIKIDELTLEDAKISKNNVAKVVVKFVTDQINVLKTSEGEILEGDDNFVQQITDMWTFQRDFNKNSPVWLLTSTKK